MRILPRKLTISLVSLLLLLAGCQKEQPVAPGDDLFGELYNLQQVVFDSLTVNQGTIEPDWGNLGVLPIGRYRKYVGKSLIKFTEFGAVADLPVDSIEQIELVMPVYSNSLDSTQSTDVTVHPFDNEWEENSTGLGLSNAFASTAFDTAVFPADDDSLTLAYGPIRLTLPDSIIYQWADTTGAYPANNGLLLQASGGDVLIFASSRFAQSYPYLDISVLVSADSVEHYELRAQQDYGYLDATNAAPGSQDFVQQATGTRMLLSWKGLLDSLNQNNIYVHSAELQIPVDTVNSYSDLKRYSLEIGPQAAADSLPIVSGNSYPFVVYEADSVITFRSSQSNSFFRRYVQQVVTENSLNTPLVLKFTSEGTGIQHLSILPQQCKLSVVYSEVR